MDKKKLVPELRFGEFEGDWESLKFGKLATRRTEKNDPKNDSENFKCIEMESIEKESGVLIKTFNSADLKSVKTKFKKGDVLFGKLRPYLKKYYYSDFDGVCTSEIWVLYSGNESNKFLYYIIQTSKFNYQINLTSGTRMPRAEWNHIKSISFNIPQIKEQQKIANFLTAIDQRITLLKQKKASLEQYKKGLMQKIFNQEIRFQDDEGNDFPDWEEKKLGKLSDVRDGTHDSPKYILDGYPLITSKNLLKNGELSFDNVSYISEEDYREINKRSNVDVGDILFGMIGTIGNPVKVKSSRFAIKNVALIKEIKLLMNDFLIHYLNNNLIAKQFYKQNAGGTQKFIALGIIRKLKIKLPCFDEQQKIANFLSATDKKITAMDEQITETESFKKGLLQRMFV